ncbi:alpha-L-rhamnosidase [Parablautia muri]|nr:alpha-L-rhamnosidase [Parablautia muri]
MRISRIFVEYQKEPIGLDEKKPRFSWQIEAKEKNTVQTACRIRVRTKEEEVWDSGRLETDNSQGIAYGDTGLSKSAELLPCREYMVRVTVWDNHGNKAEETTGFETGFMNPSIDAWEGAKWIGAPRYTVCAANRGVFVLESEFRIEGGKGRAGVVFGANDASLLERTGNELGLQGENYIRYEINLTKGEPRLDIYRVGYGPGDLADVPFASVPIVNFDGEEKQKIITAENAEQFHKMRIEVDGNNAWTYIDGILVDAVIEKLPFGEKKSGRGLNPRGTNDVLTYPRLNEIGFFAGQGGRAYFRYLSVRNLRQPFGEFIRETPAGNLYGEKSLFAGALSAIENCFVVENTQITADPSNTSIPMLRAAFDVKKEKELEKARLYITARGIYDCRINGKELTASRLNPGLTQYDVRMDYQTYDITQRLKKGKNGIGITIASGWWSEASTFVVRNYNYFGDKESVLAKLVLTYEDGSREVLVSDTERWKYYGEGPWLYSGFFAGEIFDARRSSVYETYSEGDFDDSTWGRPVEVTPVPIDGFFSMPPGFGRSWPAVNQNPDIALLGGYHGPIYITDELCAKTMVEPDPGIYVYDLQQEMAGVPRIAFHEEKGTRITIRFAEVLYPDLPEYKWNVGRIMRENYRDASSVDIYICKGEEGEVYQPRFTFHGYRYIELRGLKNPPAPKEVKSLQYSSVTEMDGNFTCSNELLNRFVQNVKWSQKCNFINIPTDCPQRNERMGWAGDTHVFCHTALLNSNLKLFYERNLRAIQDLQTPEGRYPEIAPIGGGFGGVTYECASIFMNWELYRQYGDLRTLKAFYPAMKKYMDYMAEKSGMPGKGDFSLVGPLGDWLAPEETDLQLMWNAFYFREAFLMGEFARILQIEEDALYFEKLAKRMKAYWNETFVEPGTKKTRGEDGKLCDTQCSYVLGLEYGVVADEVREAFGEHLVRKTRELEHTVGTGFFGTGLLNQALTNQGYTQDAYENLLQTRYPSWLYPVTQGATTIWERWDSFAKERGFGGQNAMNSFNHYSLGSVLSWMYHVILGIQQDKDAPKGRHFILKPETGPLSYARGGVSSPYGIIRAGWEKKGKKTVYRFEIPANTSATLILPGGQRASYGSGCYEVIYEE